MIRLKRAGTIAIFAAFTIVGLVMAVFASGSERLIGLGVAVFFGGGGTMWYLLTRDRSRPPGGFRVAPLAVRGNVRPAFVARFDVGRLMIAGAGLLAMAIPTAVFALFMGDLSVAERVVIGAGAVLAGVMGAFTLLRSRGRYVGLTRAGIVVGGAAGPVGVDWDDIAGVGEIVMHDNPMLAIRVADPSRLELGPLRRLLQGLDRSISGADLTVPVRMLDADPAELYGAIGRYLDDRDARARIGTAAELTDLRAAVASWVSVDESRDHGGETEAVAEPRPVGPRLARWALYALGGLLVAVAVIGLVDEAAPSERGSRLIGVAIIGGFGAALLVAGFLIGRGVRAGRWVGLGASVGFAGLVAVASVASDDGPNAVALVLGLMAIVCLAVVAWGTRASASGGR